MTTILMTEEYWANSPFSIARYSGSIRAFDHIFTIVNKEGKLIRCEARFE